MAKQKKSFNSKHVVLICIVLVLAFILHLGYINESRQRFGKSIWHTYKEVECDQCDGKGYVWVECTDCGGVGFVTCANCNGKGWTVCSGCGGRGSHGTCIHCGGKGYVEDSFSDYKRKCIFCEGTGLYLCSECGGMGRKICNYCGGDGTINCKTCDGKGEIQEVCSKCNGEGVVLE